MTRDPKRLDPRRETFEGARGDHSEMHWRASLILLSARSCAHGFRVAAPGRVIAIGDLHGDIDATLSTLRLAGLIDEEQKWVGADTTLVQLGDILDRGKQERECWSLLQQLRADAPATGGRVVCLCGNHEVMNVLGKAGPFLHAEGHAAFGPDRRKAWAPGGALAAELAECPVVAIVGDSAFCHATLPPDATPESVERVNTETRQWLLGERRAPPEALLGGDGSPVWDRALSSPSGVEPHPSDCVALRAALDRLGVSRVVVGHTPQRQINCACDGAVWRCDTGMSRWVVGGEIEALEVTSAGEVRILRPGIVWPDHPAVAPVTECDVDGCADVLKSLEDYS